MLRRQFIGLFISLFISSQAFAFCTYQYNSSGELGTTIVGKEYSTTFQLGPHKQCWGNHRLQNVVVKFSRVPLSFLSTAELEISPGVIDPHGWLSVDVKKNYNGQIRISIANYSSTGQVKKQIEKSCTYQSNHAKSAYFRHDILRCI